MNFHIVTLGCPKNETDSEGMEILLTEAGHSPVDDISEADVVVVNTCGFIDAAKTESLETLRGLSGARKPGSLLVAAGCLAQREGKALASQVPGIDAVVGCRNWTEIGQLLERSTSSKVPGDGGIPAYLDGQLQFGTPTRKRRQGSAFVKISDGCDAACAFCAIPSIKGPYRSKPRQQVLEEVRQLAEGGTREVVLIGQDTTAYGLDLGEKEGLSSLLREITNAVPRLPWIRVLYLYPQRVTPQLLETLAGLPQVVKYVDIPLQHTHTSVLRRMRRPHEEISGVVRRLRESIPDVAIRTTFIVGFPGETEEEHKNLLRSMKELEFDRVGVFTYSPQVGTAASTMDGQIRERVKRRRWREAMETAQQISLKRNRMQIGRELDVLVEGAEGEARGRAPMMVGRSYRDAPEVDGLVLFSGEAAVGSMVTVRVTSALEYDLVGEMVAAGPR